MKKSFLAMTLAAVLLSTGVGHAVPAKPGTLKVTQPDGSTITVQRVGDEFSHLTLTEDNRPLIKGQDGAFYFATISEDGELASSGILAADGSARKARAKAFLEQDNSDERLDAALARQRSNSRHKLPQTGLGLCSTHFPSNGEVRGLAILVEFTDQKFTLSDPQQYFYDLLNKEGFSENGATGSARDYFVDASLGQFVPTFDVVGPVTLPHDMEYYGGNDKWGEDQRVEYLAIDAADLVDDFVDFTKYDVNNDGYIDNVYIFYAGYGESDRSDLPNTVWPQSWDLSEAGNTIYRHDGLILEHFACSNEIQSSNLPDGIGTFVHEFSHVIGLPDLYNTVATSASYTPYYWSVLDIGCYLNDSNTPPTYSSYERNAMSWVEPKLITGATSITLNPFDTSNECCLVQTDTESEFYLFENRQQTGWDSYLPGHGMVIWHIDFDQKIWDNNVVNNTKSRQHVDIVEANNNPAGSKTAMAGYSWPGTSNKTTFSSTTTPAFKDWNSKAIELPITNIKEKSGVITFDVAGGTFDVSKPTNLIASDITATSFKLSWSDVDKATAYEVSVYTKDSDDNREYFIKSQEVKGENSLTVTGLEAETQYYAIVIATAGDNISDPSNELPIMTGEFIFTEAVPKTTAATSVTSNSFVANWNAVRNATQYLLTVTYTNEGAESETIADIGSSTSTYTLPDGWTTTATGIYATSGYYGAAAPSLKLAKDGQYVATALLENDITAISFWCRGASSSGGDSYITIEAYVKDAWATVETVTDLVDADSGQTVAINDFPTGTHQVRVVYHKVKGNFAIDDIVVTSKKQETLTVAGFDNLNVGNVTSYKVTGLNAGKYSYYVTARNASGQSSCTSNETKVDTSDAAGVQDIAVDTNNSNVEYFNLQGIRVDSDNLKAGIYLRRTGQKVTKVIIR
jgi:M6 family metalloprotease-like protein